MLSELDGVPGSVEARVVDVVPLVEPVPDRPGVVGDVPVDAGDAGDVETGAVTVAAGLRVATNTTSRDAVPAAWTWSSATKLDETFHGIRPPGSAAPAIWVASPRKR